MNPSQATLDTMHLVGALAALPAGFILIAVFMDFRVSTRTLCWGAIGLLVGVAAAIGSYPVFLILQGCRWAFSSR